MTAEKLQQWLEEHPHLASTDAYHRVEARLDEPCPVSAAA